jgi:VanZ family protein
LNTFALTRRIDTRWLVAAVAYAALVFFVSSRPFLRTPGPEFDLKDNLAHTMEYAVLAVLLFRALGGVVWPDLSAAFLLVWAVTASIAATDELWQGTVPGRRRDVGDWASDLIGAALALSVCAWRARHAWRASAEERAP